MRDVIQHEDDLVDHRLNWLFAGHAALFAGFVTVQADVVADKLVPQYIVVLELALAAMFAAAFVIARVDGYLIALANVSHSRGIRCTPASLLSR